jgi:hypothetical protein
VKSEPANSLKRCQLSKREFSPTGAWIHDRMLKLMLPIASREMDWMFAYDPRKAA